MHALILAATAVETTATSGGLTALFRTLGLSLGPATRALAWTLAGGGVVGFRFGVAALAAARRPVRLLSGPRTVGSVHPTHESGEAMTVFTDIELDFLRGERRLARIATVGPDGMPHVTPVGWSLDQDADTIHISGHNFATTKKFRDVARTGRAAVVIDEVLPPWRPRGVEIRGRAEAIEQPEPHIRIHPTRIVSWGLTEDGRASARGVA